MVESNNISLLKSPGMATIKNDESINIAKDLSQ